MWWATDDPHPPHPSRGAGDPPVLRRSLAVDLGELHRAVAEAGIHRRALPGVLVRNHGVPQDAARRDWVRYGLA